MLAFANEENKDRSYMLTDMVSDAEEFCIRMGFPVYDSPFCYNGFPTASKINLGKKKPSGSPNHPRNKGTVGWTFA